MPAERPDETGLPVADILPALLDALAAGGNAVLVAPPGAGKTTLVPLALLDAPWRGDGLILLLEPRRIAARAAARRMAALLGEEVGGRVGYAMRMDQRRGLATRVLVVTEGVLSRLILDDPELPGVAAVIFDEFHERSLDADFGLALALEVQGALRPDLRIVAMSATLDGAAVARLMGGCPVVESAGRAFPVAIRHRDRTPGAAIEDEMASAIRAALAEETGSILAFLPGQAEIRRTAERLEGRVPADTDVVPLHGQLDGRAQDAAIRPAPAGRRKVVLATAVAETSVTIDGVRIVIDSGLSRQPRYEPATGLTRLETVRVSRAAADQRAGRAGRTAPGVAIRLWRAEQTAALDPFAPPEILEADLSGLLLDCAAFGETDPRRLPFLDPPPLAALAEARSLLAALEAVDADGRLTPAGAAMRRLPLPVRLAHMVAAAPAASRRDAALLAVLATERGLGGDGIDLERRLERLRGDRSPRAEAARAMAGRFAATVAGEEGMEPVSAGALMLLAYPDRAARARGERGRYVLANGRGGVLDAADQLAGHDWLVVADLQGRAQNARIALAVAVEEADVRAVLADRLERRTETRFDAGRGTLRMRETLRLGAILVSERMLPPPAGAEADRAVLAAVRAHGLGLLDWGLELEALRGRLAWLHATLGEPWPDMSDAALLAGLDDWLLPFLAGAAAPSAIDRGTLRAALLSLVPHDLVRKVDGLAPTHFDAPSGSRVPIRYDEAGPVLAIRVQELFGLSRHPVIADGRVPLTLELLSPAHRPIQTTRDLPGFWRGSWADVRTDMRGRYPRHVWPEDPQSAAATSRAKPRAK